MIWWDCFFKNGELVQQALDAETYDAKYSHVVAVCSPEYVDRVRNGLEMQAIADPEIYCDADELPESEDIWNENIVRLMLSSSQTMHERIKYCLRKYARELDLKDNFYGEMIIDEIGEDSITVRVQKAIGSNLPFDKTHTIPLCVLWDYDYSQRFAAQKKQEKEEADAAAAVKAAEKAEKHDRAEYERLKAKYEGATNA
jgi:hypothetical protein